MAGQIKHMIDWIVAQKAHGNKAIASSMRTKIILRGIMIDNYTENSTDDRIVIEKLKAIANELGTDINRLNL